MCIERTERNRKVTYITRKPLKGKKKEGRMKGSRRNPCSLVDSQQSSKNILSWKMYNIRKENINFIQTVNNIYQLYFCLGYIELDGDNFTKTFHLSTHCELEFFLLISAEQTFMFVLKIVYIILAFFFAT